MSFCGQCGEHVEAEARFCGSCGATVVEPPSEAAVQAVFDPIPLAEPALRDEEWLRPARRSFSPAAIVGFIALVLLAGGATVLLLHDDDSNSGPANTATTVTTAAAVTATTVDTGSTTTVVASTTPATAAPTTVPLPPDQQLAARRDADHPAVEAIVGRWVPQLSAKKAGTVDNGITYGLADVVAYHEGLRREYGALLLFSGDYVYQTTNLWVSIAPQSFATAQGAIDWCVSKSIGRDDCFAKLITHDASIIKTTQMQP